MKILAHDFETTGVDPRTCGVVQSAIAIVEIDIHGNWTIAAEEVALHHPGCMIPDGAAQVHGITDQMVAGYPDYEESVPATYAQAMEEFEPAAVLGYNSNSFDNVIARRLGLPAEGLIELDLMVAAQRLMALGHLERARLVDAYEGLTGNEAVNAHDAMADVHMTLELIKPTMKLMEFEDFPTLVDWLTKPIVSVEMPMPFGKHKGTPINQIPRGYLGWLSKNAGLRGDLAASVQVVLNGG